MIDVKKEALTLEAEKVMDVNYVNRDDHKSFVMCPTPGCTYKMPGTWNDYLTGKKVNGLHEYRCPSCGQTFTINNFKVNAVPIPNEDGLAVFYNTSSDKIVYQADGKNRFTDAEGISYLHIPLLVFDEKDVKMYYFTDIDVDKEGELNEDEIVANIKALIREQNKRKGILKR